MKAELATTRSGWANIKKAAAWCSVSERTLRDWIKNFGLPHARVGGCLRVSYADLDFFMRSFSVNTEAAAARVDKVVAEALAGLR